MHFYKNYESTLTLIIISCARGSSISLIHHMIASRTSPIESSIAINGVRANNKCLIHPDHIILIAHCYC